MGVESLADWWTRPAGQTQLDQIQLVDQIQLETSNPFMREQSSRPEHAGARRPSDVSECSALQVCRRTILGRAKRSSARLVNFCGRARASIQRVIGAE